MIFNLHSAILFLQRWPLAALSSRWPLRGFGLLSQIAVWIPLLGLAIAALEQGPAIWLHLFNTLLPLYIRTTLLLGAGVAFGTLLIGGSTAWLISRCQFPACHLFKALLILPLAVPTWLAAFVYTEVFEYSGPVQQWLHQLGWQGRLPEIRSTSGAMLAMSVTLYPYVYVLARQAFAHQPLHLWESGRSLGLSSWQCFWKIALPMAKPALLLGALLAVLEVLADFGTVEYFAIPTLTVGIYRIWFSMGNPAGGAQLALFTVACIGGLLMLIRVAKSEQRRVPPVKIQRQKIALKGAQRWIAVACCTTPVLLGFGIPLLWLLQATWGQALSVSSIANYADLIKNSVVLSLWVALLCVLMGLFIAYGMRLTSHRWWSSMLQLGSLGYAMPGIILALGMLTGLGWLDEYWYQWLQKKPPFWLGGTLFAVMLGCMVRFLALALHNIQSAMHGITPLLDQSVRALGYNTQQALFKLHIPLLSGALGTSVLLVGMDTLKELPITLLLRPFGFDTLSTKIYELASLERFEEAAFPSLVLIALTTLPLLWLLKEKTHQSE